MAAGGPAATRFAVADDVPAPGAAHAGVTGDNPRSTAVPMARTLRCQGPGVLAPAPSLFLGAELGGYFISVSWCVIDKVRTRASYLMCVRAEETLPENEIHVKKPNNIVT